MSAFLYLVAGVVFAYVVVYYGLFRAVRCTWSGTLSGKTAIVTGNIFGILLKTNKNSEVRVYHFESSFKMRTERVDDFIWL